MRVEVARKRVVRARRISGAFLRVAFRLARSYPLSFAMTQLKAILPILTYFFIAKLIGGSGRSVGGDYFTFTVTGLAVLRTMQASLQGFGDQLDRATNQGRLEALLSEPVPWRAIPFGLVQWPVLIGLVSTALLIGLSIPLGAEYRAIGFLPAAALLAMGAAASFGVGILSAGAKILTKRSDPIITIYVLLGGLLTGAVFPLELLPGWLRTFSWLLPHTYVIGAVRTVLMPGAPQISGPTGATAVLGLMVFITIVFPLALWTFGRAMQVGRRLGILGGY